jgi:hypothetical protein
MSSKQHRSLCQPQTYHCGQVEHLRRRQASITVYFRQAYAVEALYQKLVAFTIGNSMFRVTSATRRVRLLYVEVISRSDFD